MKHIWLERIRLGTPGQRGNSGEKGDRGDVGSQGYPGNVGQAGAPVCLKTLFFRITSWTIFFSSK